MTTCGFCETTEADRQLLLFDTDFWRVFLSENQSYLGRCIVVLNRHCASLSALNASEWEDLHTLIIKLETLFTQSLGATMFNWTCLMNKSYQSDPPDPHVHLHLRPRFANPVEIQGVIFEDTDFAHHYDSKSTAELPQHITDALMATLKTHMQS